MTADMSTSLNVVSIAASCCAATRRCAILARSGLILRRVCRPDGEGGLTIAEGAVIGAGAFADMAAGAGAAGASGVLVEAAASMSPLVTRPAFPVPDTAFGSTPVSVARRRTAGD